MGIDSTRPNCEVSSPFPKFDDVSASPDGDVVFKIDFIGDTFPEDCLGVPQEYALPWSTLLEKSKDTRFFGVCVDVGCVVFSGDWGGGF